MKPGEVIKAKLIKCLNENIHYSFIYDSSSIYHGYPGKNDNFYEEIAQEINQAGPVQVTGKILNKKYIASCQYFLCLR